MIGAEGRATFARLAPTRMAIKNPANRFVFSFIGVSNFILVAGNPGPGV